MEKASLEMPNSTCGDREPQARSFKTDLQNDDNDPAKLRERLARLQADFENARKRSVKEQQEFNLPAHSTYPSRRNSGEALAGLSLLLTWKPIHIPYRERQS
jgi:hypothetical protein